jgi:hypothetical protein
VSDPIRAIADAVLYEGYILWPYRRSALKNQRRFTFGGVYPPAHSAEHPDDPCAMRTEVLVTGGGEVEVTVRFLQVVERTVLEAAGRPVDQLEVDGEPYLTWEEAVEREVRGPGPIAIAAGSEREEIDRGRGSVVRDWEALQGAVDVATAPAAPDVRRLVVTVRNETPFAQSGTREAALKRTFCSTHTLLHIESGEFVSMADPPPELAELAASCANLGTWPTLVGEPGDRRTVLSSPIILDDYPRIAPESPGDLFDGGEIDQLLILNILAMTDEEKAEMAASDPRAREILERTEALTPAELMALHGTIREFGLVR